MWLLILFTIYVILTLKSVQKIFKGEFNPDIEKLKQSLTSSTSNIIASHIVTITMSALLISFYVYASIAVQNTTFYYMSVAQCIFCIMICFRTIGLINKLSTNELVKFAHPILQILMVVYDAIYGYMFVSLGGLNNLF